MTRSNPPVDEADENDLEIGKPKEWAAGIPGVYHSMQPALKHMGIERSARTLLAMNQKQGFDCMSCAWPDPSGHRSTFEYCENGAKAVTWEATPVTVASDFWAEHPISELRGRSEYWLGMQGRLTEPVYKAAGDTHYRPIDWDTAINLVSEKLKGLSSPDEAAFYTSGRASNEAAFIYQLFIRGFGTNNMPDCSNMCHESSGVAMGETIGVGKATVAYDDFLTCDLMILIGQNPGTNHPRMLSAMEKQKENGGQIVAVNPLPEAGLRRFKNPQKPRGILGRGTDLADQFLKIRAGGDMALLQAVSKRVLEAEERTPGRVLDQEFIAQHCAGLVELREHLSHLEEQTVLDATGLRSEEIDELTDRYINADSVIITWAMGVTQQKNGVGTIKEIINLLLLRGNFGRPGAGASPIRGHSNVQGDRTMGIWEQMPASFLDALGREFSFEPPREHGVDSVAAVRGMRDGDIRFFLSLGGNFAAAMSDTAATEAAMQNLEMNVQISTKLNRSHTVVGQEALILPTLGRTEIDVQASGPQFVSVEDTVSAVHSSEGRVEPVAPGLLSEVAIVSRIAQATLGPRIAADWQGFEDDYDLIREHISHVVPGCEHYNQRIREKDGFLLANGPRDSRTFNTPSGRARMTVNELDPMDCPSGRLILQTMRSHDQFNTTIYGYNDRYRGIKKGRHVILVNPEDLALLGFRDGDLVDVHGEYLDGKDRVLRGFRAVSYPTARGCAAVYYPEGNVLVPLDDTVQGSNTPVSKGIIIRLERATNGPAGGSSEENKHDNMPETV
ncbi:FdhF/YdeP family oxidoreductase [Nesterenkonia sandarakina]|uniref:Formate dehydrogenase major subunit n=1 Tax=Nesterenkonia sandarakina TaxID=272918 RepID=A0A2T0YLK4_9MICC|nr:FdhF/YdeP family oxidoreductase [Nesterenkonia sandarakina]PRZ16107.1 formate dehydrogenase major subunit [Nesterenkonia sandarakina]